jgi:hypothetical protein
MYTFKPLTTYWNVCDGDEVVGEIERIKYPRTRHVFVPVRGFVFDGQQLHEIEHFIASLDRELK